MRLGVDKNNINKIIEELREKGDVIPVIADPIFKSIFRNEEMKGILSFIISEITDLNEDYIYENLEYRDSYIRKQNITHKDNTSDLIVDIDDNVISLEMNVENTMYNRFRNVAHYHSLIVNNILISKKREEVGQIYQINFDVKRSYSNKLVSRIMMRDEDGQIDMDEISFQKYKVNLSILDKKGYNVEKLTRFERILLMIQERNKEKLFILAKGDKELENMAKNIVKLNMDTKYVSLYDEDRLDKLARDFERAEMREEGLAEGKAQGIKEGIKEGKKEGKKEGIKETAKKLLEAKVDINIIANSTGLSKEEIENL